MKKQIYTGAESFEDIIKGNNFYVDKSLFIKEMLENQGKVTLITRPRRFGKTLNLSTIEYFFDVNLDSRSLFEGLKIMEHKDIVEKYMNKYPVISLTLKDVEEDNWENCVENMRDLVSDLYKQHLHIIEQNVLDETDREMIYHTEEAKRLKTGLNPL